jgi:uncharacterized protein YndB with AHSA1/START domain
MPASTEQIQHELRVDARPETVFSYFTDPRKFVVWMGAEATLDPRPGGICRILFDPSRTAIELIDPATRAAARTDASPAMSGRFTAVEPHERIAFTWGWEQELYAVPPQSTSVEVELTPDGDGTILRLTHRRLPNEIAVKYHTDGWDHYLPRLALAAAGGDPGHDPWQTPRA